MVRVRIFASPIRAALLAVTASVLCSLAAASAHAAHPDIFYNFYNGPSVRGGVPAQLYVSPRPTPPFVGHTWITYPPLMPHEFMYCHKRSYYKYYREGGWVSAKVCYH